MTRCSAFAAQILVREVEELLIVRVGMDGGHRAAMDSKRFVEDFGDGGETVCGAGGVRNDMVLRRIVGFVVHAEDEGGVRSIGRRGDDDFFHRCAKMLLRVGALGEKTGGLDDDVRADRGPVDFGRIFRLENLEALPFHGDGAFGVRDGVRQVAEDGVVLQKVCERLGIGDVIDGDELNVLVVERGAHDVASDAAEAVDADLNGHYFLRWELSRIAAVKERVTAAAAQEMLWAAWTKVNAGKIWAAIMACDEGVGTCIGFALAVRFRTRRGRPLAPSLDFSARAGVHLLFRVFLAGLSNSRIDWAARNSSRQRISASLIRTIRPCELLVRADAVMVFERVTRAHGALLGGNDRFAACGIEFLAARHAGDLFCLLSLVRQCRTGFFRLPVRWDVAGSGIYCDVSCAARFSTGLGRRQQTFARECFSAGLGMLPDLFRIWRGEDPGRGSAVAELHGARRVLPEWPAANLDWLVHAALPALVPRGDVVFHTGARTRTGVGDVSAAAHSNRMLLHRDGLANRHHSLRKLHVLELPRARARDFAARRPLCAPLFAIVFEEE